MVPQNFIFVKVLVCVLFSTLCCRGGVVVPPAKGSTYALIIGVADYKDEQITDLQFSDDDALAFYDFLKSPSGGSVDTNNIRLLLQDRATVANVYNSMKHFKDKLKKNDKFYLYFAGHGDAESSIYKLGYLLAHDTPFHNYLNNAIRIEDFNDLATTLSVNMGVEVIIITDACKSGSLTGIDNIHKKALVQEQLMKAQEKEVRFASCEPGQLSQENAVWGGGRGVFSYFLIKGLQGEADANKDKSITVQEVSTYVKGNVQDEMDDLLLDEQIPVSDGIFDKVMATIPEGFDVSQIGKSKDISTENKSVNGGVRSISGLGLSATQRFVNQLNGMNYFSRGDLKLALAGTSDEYLSELLEDHKQIIISSKDINVEDVIIDNSKYVDRVVLNADMQQELKNEIAVAYHDIVQGIINVYLAGDEAELEERRYYNVDSLGYVKYLDMLTMAERLLESDHPLQSIIKIKKHYLTGIIARLQIPTTHNLDSILNIAYHAQQKAVSLAPKAAYVHNELGIIYVYKNDLQNGIKHFNKAIDASNEWAIPYANLAFAYLKLGGNAKALQHGLKADSLQNNLHLAKTNLGLVYNKKRNYLFAEEYFNKAIKINNRHFLPFDGLGEVYTNLTQYEKSDSFYYEAAMRKLNTNFEDIGPNGVMYNNIFPLLNEINCPIDTSAINEEDIITLFIWGMKHFKAQNYNHAIRIWQKVIEADPDNPLAFYYSGVAYFKIKEWRQSELMFNYSIDYFLDAENFVEHIEDWVDKVSGQPDPDCLFNSYYSYQYAKYNTYFFLGDLYDKWHHYEEAILEYEELLGFFLKTDKYYKIACLLKLAILEKLNQWETAELFIENHFTKQEDFYTIEKNVFYDRAIEVNPVEGFWYFKKGLHLKTYSENSERIGLLDTILYHPMDKGEFFVTIDHYKTSDYIEEAYNPTRIEWKELPKVSSFYIESEDYVVEVPGTMESVTFESLILTPKRDAIVALKSALKLYFNKDMTADIRYKIGELYVASGSHSLAFSYFNDAVEDKPNRATYQMRAINSGTEIYENRIVYEHLLRTNSDTTINHKASLQLAHFSAYKGDYPMSKKTIDEIRSYSPYVLPELKELEALIMALNHEYDASIKAYDELEVSTSRTHEKYYTLARLYGMKGDHSKAKKWLKKAINAGFYYPFVLDAEPLWYTIFGKNGWREKHELKAAPKMYNKAYLVSASYSY